VCGIAFDLLGVPYNACVAEGMDYSVPAAVDLVLGNASPAASAFLGRLTNSFSVTLLDSGELPQPLRVFFRAVEFDTFENEDLGVVEHIFTKDENYGIGKSYTEAFQHHTSAGDDAISEDL